jgi:hypothetical protein
MSVDDSRFAAAQRTAARRRGTTSKRLKAWVVVVPTLMLFAAALGGGAAAFRKPDYAKTARTLPSAGGFVLVSAAGEHSESWLDRLMRSSGKELCSVTAQQLEQVALHYEVSYLTVTVDGRSLQIAKVSGQGANDHELREYLGDPKLTCKFVREGGIFFLPFDPNVS